MEDKAIDQASSRVSNKFLAYAFISLLFGSNILNTYVGNQLRNTEAIESNNRANGRRLEHAVEKQDFKNTIILLEFKLEECNDK